MPESWLRYIYFLERMFVIDISFLRSAVKLPPGEDPNEWLAVNSKIQPFLSNVVSHRFFQPNQSSLREHYRVLHAKVVSSHVRRTKVIFLHISSDVLGTNTYGLMEKIFEDPLKCPQQNMPTI
jgi:hypothetical protein